MKLKRHIKNHWLIHTVFKQFKIKKNSTTTFNPSGQRCDRRTGGWLTDLFNVGFSEVVVPTDGELDNLIPIYTSLLPPPPPPPPEHLVTEGTKRGLKKLDHHLWASNLETYRHLYEQRGQGYMALCKPVSRKHYDYYSLSMYPGSIHRPL